MKANIKTGFKSLTSKKWNDIKEAMIINFTDKNTYISFTQKRNHLLIDTTEGEIDIVFSGDIPKLNFESFCKDQLILKVIN